MPDLNFSVESAGAVTFAASPMLSFKLSIRNANSEERIQSIGLRCQIQIETTKRKYSATEQAQLFELFGEPERWGRTLRSMLWVHTSAMVPPFQGETIIDLPVPCTFDFNIAATKYFAGLEDGLVPLNLMFSGTVFFESSDGGLQIEQISWDKEAHFKLPVQVWREMMDHYYPNTAWLSLRRDAFERLSRYKMLHAIPTWEQAIESLIPVDAQPAKEEELAIEGEFAVVSAAANQKGNLVERIADAVLYEGYILYPYRPSAVKNQQRWNFGVVCPPSWEVAQRGTESSTMRTECLIEADSTTTVDVKVRFLHLMLREVSEADVQLPWQEAGPREVVVERIKIGALESPQCVRFEFLASRTTEPPIVRTQHAIAGEIEIAADRLSAVDDRQLVKLSVVIRNLTPFAAANSRDDALMRSFVSAHTILEAQRGSFVSLLDPPEHYRAAATACVNTGTYPVLVGDEGDRNCVLSSPIILYDYPQIASESAGDLFDGTEIDEILTLRIMSLTDDEKREMRSADELARKLLERTESMSPEQLMNLHGVMKKV